MNYALWNILIILTCDFGFCARILKNYHSYPLSGNKYLLFRKLARAKKITNYGHDLGDFFSGATNKHSLRVNTIMPNFHTKFPIKQKKSPPVTLALSAPSGASCGGGLLQPHKWIPGCASGSSNRSINAMNDANKKLQIMHDNESMTQNTMLTNTIKTNHDVIQDQKCMYWMQHEITMQH